MMKYTSRSYILSLRKLSFSIAGFLLLLVASIILIRLSNEHETQIYSAVYRYIPYFFSFVSIPISTFIFKKIIEKRTLKVLTEKLMAYRQAHILRIALIESPGILAACIFLISGDWLTLIPVPLSLIFILVNNPSSQKIIDELGLEGEEAALIESSDSYIL